MLIKENKNYFMNNTNDKYVLKNKKMASKMNIPSQIVYYEDFEFLL